MNVIEAACRGHFKETWYCLVLADLFKHPIIQSLFIERLLNIQHVFQEKTGGVLQGTAIKAHSCIRFTMRICEHKRIIFPART